PVSLALDHQRAFAPLDDVDVVRLRVVVNFSAPPARRKAVEMHVDLLGAERRVDQLDLLAAPARHRADRALAKMHELEHRSLRAQANPCTASSFAIRDAASSGSCSTRALSARRNSSARCKSERALSWPPTMTK